MWDWGCEHSDQVRAVEIRTRHDISREVCRELEKARGLIPSGSSLDGRKEVPH